MLLGSGPVAGGRQDLEKFYTGFKQSCLGHVAAGRHEEEAFREADGTRWDDWQWSPCHCSPRVGRDGSVMDRFQLCLEDEAVPQRQGWE